MNFAIVVAIRAKKYLRERGKFFEKR